ncbi:MAG: CvpA family protein [Rhodospirillales bacterium]|nr:CvpA family protein [Rhodospirillales bacterium]
MLGPLTYLDAALLAVALLSGLLAMYRGLTREVLSILSWIVAAAAVLYFVLYHRQTAEQLAVQFHAPLAVAQVVVGGIIFLVVLIIVHLITARISDTILDSRIGIIDRILGFVFGVVRGFVLIVIPYMFYESFVPNPADQFPWVRDASSLPYIKSTGNTFRTVLTRVVPGSLMAPGEQQGFLLENPVWQADAAGKRYSFVIYTRTAG